MARAKYPSDAKPRDRSRGKTVPVCITIPQALLDGIDGSRRIDESRSKWIALAIRHELDAEVHDPRGRRS